MKKVLKKFLRKRKFAFVNTKYRWGVDLYSDVNKILKDDRLLTVMDVGANEGVFSKELLESLPVKKLYAIEPGQSAFGILSSTFSGIGLVKCDRFAVGEKSGTCVLYTYPDSKKNTLDFSLRDETRKDEGKPEEIEMVSLDEYTAKNNISQVDLLKIDVEGNELSVLKGATGLFHTGSIKLIFCEFHKILAFENNKSAHTDLGSMVEFLEPYDLRFVSLYTQGVHFHENIVTCNVLFAHKSLFKEK